MVFNSIISTLGKFGGLFYVVNEACQSVLTVGTQNPITLDWRDFIIGGTLFYAGTLADRYSLAEWHTGTRNFTANNDNAIINNLTNKIPVKKIQKIYNSIRSLETRARIQEEDAEAIHEGPLHTRRLTKIPRNSY